MLPAKISMDIIVSPAAKVILAAHAPFTCVIEVFDTSL